MFSGQAPSDTGKPLTNCAVFAEDREDCEKSIEVATTNFPGTVLGVSPLSHEEAKQKYGVLLDKWGATVWEIKIELFQPISLFASRTLQEESSTNIQRIIVLTDPSAKLTFPVKYEVDAP